MPQHPPAEQLRAARHRTTRSTPPRCSSCARSAGRPSRRRPTRRRSTGPSHEIAHITRHLLDGPGHHRAAEEPRGRGREGPRPGSAALRQLTRVTSLDVAPRRTDAALALLGGRPLVVLTGAGLSTDSGIPDYRGPGSPSRMPMTYQEFVSGSDAAAALLGAQPPRLVAGCGGAEPNAGHRALAALDPDAADHPERRRPARARRLASPGRPARPDRRRRLPGLPGGHAARGRCRADGRRQPGLGRRATPPPPPAPTATSTSTTPPASWCPAARAAACSSPTWCSSARTCPRRGWQRCYDGRRRAAGSSGALLVRRLVADGDERLPVRAPGGQGRHPGGDRQPGRVPAATSWRRTRSRPGARSSSATWSGITAGLRRLTTSRHGTWRFRPYCFPTKMWAAASRSISAASPPEPTSTPASVRRDADDLVGQRADAAQGAHQDLVLLQLLGDPADADATPGRRPGGTSASDTMPSMNSSA